MSDVKSIGFALDPNNVPSFLLDWEITKLCNLDCSYCGTGHDNSTQHPPLAECLKTIDFMYEYVNQYMQHKKPSQRKVILNVYGGESLFHPNIVEILETCRSKYQQYKDKWYLTVINTTNAIVGKNQWARIIPLIDEFTVSYHAENLLKQKELFKTNLLELQKQNKRFKCVVMMHKNYWNDVLDIIEFCKINAINYVAKPIDGVNYSYSPEQFKTLKTFWMQSVPISKQSDYKKTIDKVGETTDSSLNQGRSCCGGRKLSINNDLKSSVGFVPKQGFRGWSCSVNWFFLFIDQLKGEVYTNKDCRTSTTNLIEPLGYLSNPNQILDTLKTQLASNMPIIQCIKDICVCGYCAPKAQDKKDFMDLIRRNVPVDIFAKTC
jgi:organic radical activating enzyme